MVKHVGKSQWNILVLIGGCIVVLPIYGNIEDIR